MRTKYRADSTHGSRVGRAPKTPRRESRHGRPGGRPALLPRKARAGRGPSRPAGPQQPPDLSAGDRQDRPSDDRGGDLARQADPPRRQGRPRPHDQGEPAPGRENRDGLQGFRPAAARPDQRGQHRPGEGGRALRPPQGRQALDLRRLVDQAVDQAGARQPVEDDPPARPPGRQDLQDAQDGHGRSPRAWAASPPTRSSRWSCRSRPPRSPTSSP